MDALLKPDLGLTFWTVVNFVILAFLLAKFAWKPVTAALDERERKIAADIEGAKAANEDAQKIKQDLTARLDTIAKEAAAKIKEAAAVGEKEKAKILEDAQKQAQGFIESARLQIKAETESAVAEIKGELVSTAMMAVKKIIAKEADEKTNAMLVEDLLKDIAKK